MRLLFFTNRDLPSCLMLNLVLPELRKRHEVHVFLSESVGKKAVAEPPDALKRLRFFEQTMPNELLFPALEKNEKRLDGGPHFLTFAELSKKFDTPFETIFEIKSEAALEHFRALEPDLALSVRFGKIFGKKALEIPKQGFLNLHSGHLPAFRGVLATFRALEKGEKNLGCTLHFIDDATIDTGRIVAFSSFEKRPDRSVFWHVFNQYPVAAPMFLQSVERIAGGFSLETKPQKNEAGAYFSFPTAEEIAAFEAQTGQKMIDPPADLELFKKWIG